MPVIKPRTRGKQFVRVAMRLEAENHETVHAYAVFIGEKTDYVINEVVDTILARDPDYVSWRREHAESFVPDQATHSARRRRRARSPRTTAAPTEPSPAAASGTTSDRPYFR